MKSKRCKIKNSGGKKRLARPGEEEKDDIRRSGTELQTSSASGLIKISPSWVAPYFGFLFFFLFLMDFAETAVRDWGRAVSSGGGLFNEGIVGWIWVSLPCWEQKQGAPAVVLSSPRTAWNMSWRVNDSEELRLFFLLSSAGLNDAKIVAALQRLASGSASPLWLSDPVFLLMLTVTDRLQKNNDNWRSSKRPAALEQQLTCWLTGKFRLIFFTC